MFSRIGNFLYHSSVNKNSISYINKQNENITLDPSGTNYVEYSTDSDYFTEAHSLIPNSETQVTTTALKLQDSSTPANNFFFSSLAVSSLGDFTLCVKHKLNAPSTSTDIISHYFTSPQYDITLSVPYVSETIPFNVFVSKASDGPLDYEVSGNLTIADLTNGDISGTLSTVESVLPYTLNAGTSGKDFVFLLNDLDISLNTTIYTQYTVTVTVVDSSPAFSLNGVSKKPISFTGGVSYVFDQSDSTNAGYQIMFGTTSDVSSTEYTTGVTEVGTPGQAGAYTKIEYSGSTQLYYFNADTENMGNPPPNWVKKVSVVVSNLPYQDVTIGSSRIYTTKEFYDKNLGLIKNNLNDGDRMSKNGEYVLDAESYAMYRRRYDRSGNNISTDTLVPFANGSHRPSGKGVISDLGSVIISPRISGISISFNGSSMGGHSNPQYFLTDTNYSRTKGLSGSGNCFIAAYSNTLRFYSISISGTTITDIGSTIVSNITGLNDYPIPISYNGLIYALKHYVSSESSWKVYKRNSEATTNHAIIGEFSGIGNLSLSSDGTHVAVTEPTTIETKNVISVYKYDESETSWTKIGSSIDTNPASSSSPTTAAFGYIDDSLTTLYIADFYPSASKTLKKYDFE